MSRGVFKFRLALCLQQFFVCLYCMSVDRKQDLILNTQDFQQGQLPDCDGESEEQSLPRRDTVQNTLRKSPTKTGSKNKNLHIEDDRTSSSSQGSESSASYMAVELDGNDSRSERSEEKPSFRRNQRSSEYPGRRRDLAPRSFVSAEKNPSQQRPKPYHQNPRNYHQQPMYYPGQFPESPQYYAPHPNSYMYPQPQFHNPSASFFPNSNNPYMNPNLNHNMVHNINPTPYHHPQYPPAPQQGYGYQMNGYNSYNAPKYPSSNFQESKYDTRPYKNSKHQIAYQQKSEIKGVINRVMSECGKKQQILRVVLECVVDGSNELSINRLGEYWGSTEYRGKVEQVLKVLQSEDVIRRLNHIEEMEVQRKREEANVKRDPRLRD